MAEKTIGLRLQINGIPQTITNIKQLEETIAGLEGELKGVEIGSQKFNQLSTEIRTARGRLEDFNKSTEGFGFEKLVESVAKFSAGVTSAFAAAGAAAQLFGGDSEEVNKAAQKAQNLLTLAISATSIAEGILAAKKLLTRNATIAQTATTVVATAATGTQTAATVALTGAEVAATSATVGLTGAIKALGVAIRSNPIGIIIGLLAAAAAAMVIFGGETDNSAEAVAKLDREIEKLLQSQDQLINQNENALQKEIALAEARGASIEELAKLRQKGIQAEIDNAKKRQQILKDAQEKEIAIQTTELNKKTINQEEYNKRILEIEKKYGGQIFQQKTAQAAADTKLEIDKIQTQSEIRDRNIRLNEKSRDLEVSLIKNNLVRRLAELEKTYTKEYTAEENNNATRLLLTKNYVQDRAEILANAEKANLELQIKIAKELQDVTLNSYEVQLRDLKYNNQQQLQIFLDNSKELNETSKEKNQKNYEIELFGKTQTYKLTEEQYKSLLKLQKTYQIQEGNALELFEKQKNKTLLDLDKQALESRIKFQNYESELFKDANIEVIQARIDSVIKKEKEVYEKDFESFKKTELDKLQFQIESDGQRLGKSGEELTKYIEQSIEGYEGLFDLIKQNGLKEIELNNKKLYQQQIIDQLTKQSTINRLEEEQMYYVGIAELQEKYLLDDKMSKKEIENNDKELKRKLRDQDLAYQKDQLMMQRQLVLDKIKVLEKDPTMNAEALKTLYAELAKITVDYNNKVREENTNTATDTEEQFQDLIGNIQKVVDTFSQTIGQIGSLLSQSYSLQLEQLELDYQNTLSQIVGDTEEANILREKEEIMYQNKKKAIEKKARIDSLNIQLAQAVADSASAVLKTLAQYGATPVGIALSILAGGLGLVQIGLIAQQKNMVQSMARGGFLRGPSHEQGGIKYQGGGVELEGNEAVINRRSTLEYAPLLSQINEQGGGKPIYVNSIMDSRMAEVLASTRNEPIRAYVLEQDITKSQAVNRRLEELASF